MKESVDDCPRLQEPSCHPFAFGLLNDFSVQNSLNNRRITNFSTSHKFLRTINNSFLIEKQNLFVSDFCLSIFEKKYSSIFVLLIFFLSFGQFLCSSGIFERQSFPRL